MKRVRECSNCGYALMEIGTHTCEWQRGTIYDANDNEKFQIAGTEAWVCIHSGQVLESVPISCDPNELGLKCFKRNVPKDADVPF